MQEVLAGLQRLEVVLDVDALDLLNHEVVLTAELENLQVLHEVLVGLDGGHNGELIIINLQFLDDPEDKFQLGNAVGNELISVQSPQHLE